MTRLTCKERAPAEMLLNTISLMMKNNMGGDKFKNQYLWYMETARENIEQLATRLKEGFPGILFAYLFGSAAKGEMNISSDIDIALYLNEDVDKLKLLPEIIGVAEKIFPGREIDILVFNDASELIALEALKGIILFIREESRDFHAEFYSLTCRMSEDHLAWMKRQLNYRGYEVQWDY